MLCLAGEAQVEPFTPMTRGAPRPRTAQRVALIAGSLVGVLSFVGPDAGGRYGLLVVVVAAFAGWLASRAGASPWRVISSALLVVVAALLSRVITFVVLYLWAFG